MDTRSLLRSIRNSEPMAATISALSQPFSPANAKSNPRVVALTGGKGGVGKTLTTANLGLCLAAQGMRVLLLDGDFGLANLDVILGVQPLNHIDDVLAGRVSLAEVILDGPGGIRLIPAGSGLMKSMGLNPAERYKLIEAMNNLEEEFDVVLVDTPAGAGEQVQQLVSSCGEALLVVSPDPTSLSDTYALMKILNKTRGIQSFQMIVNMASHPSEGERIFERLASVAADHLPVHVGFLGSVCWDESMRRSVRERRVCVQRYPFSPSASDFRSIANAWSLSSPRSSSAGGLQFFFRRVLSGGVN